MPIWVKRVTKHKIRDGTRKICTKTTKNSRALIPDKYLEEFKKVQKFLDNYKSALSTGTAIGAMCFTNFAIDAPLTVWLTNKLNAKNKSKKVQDKKSEVIYA